MRVNVWERNLRFIEEGILGLYEENLIYYMGSDERIVWEARISYERIVKMMSL
ncbi:hypothetical protein [Borrelia miyamotoi]|uniref:Uncharacterized protein n=1 Tax=Borrelia miyamotoi TaxID=47466 RepID=A0AAQ2WXW0_9SPIR|nr:hypothetical protein [Borrelia miyamotoi]QTL84153.1 hypothetical protein bmLB2001_001133 [Borrelia miyamotoi]QTL84160.1 hypothetical protein bmLB2001_001076 [Borrelia miyamotoi]QTL84340.1 hypothetical protein bmLB2001_001056 [Borrelia miyamotoi]QTL84355.1 hypothetical protein bmLB2001_001034 [Borrelia miyamotoi]WAZ85801.1 hypothetical protein O5400_05480 [Borrelia miyamotoi]